MMKSLTRSGRLYKNLNKDNEAEKRSSALKYANKNAIVTPVKVTNQQQEQLIQNQNEPQAATDEPFSTIAFDYCVEQELNGSEQDCKLFNADDSAFKYSISNASDNESNTGETEGTQVPMTGPPNYTQHPVTPVRLGRKCMEQERNTAMVDQCLELECALIGYAAPVIKSNTYSLLTVPIRPFVPRNQYGGIRDCLPPIQLTRMQPAVPQVPASSIDADATSRRVLTAEQLLRIENNRLAALAKLRAKQANS